MLPLEVCWKNKGIKRFVSRGFLLSRLMRLNIQILSLIFFCVAVTAATTEAQEPGRITDEYRENEEKVHRFSINFTFSGFNLSDLEESYLRELATIPHLTLDPVVNGFQEMDCDCDVKQVSSANLIIEIIGERLDVSATENYRIEVGLNGTCEIKSLLADQIQCQLPAIPPPPDVREYKLYNGKKALRVKVFLGNLAWHVGYVVYNTKLWDNERFRAGIISLTVIIPSTTVLALAVGFVCRRSVRGSKNNAKFQSQEVQNTVYQNDVADTRMISATFKSISLP